MKRQVWQDGRGDKKMRELCGAILVLVAAFGVFAAEKGVKIDFSQEIGPVKPVNGVGQPPMLGGPTRFSMMHYLAEAGIPYSRLHDVQGSHYVDIPKLFPDFDADENDPANYDFAFTDKLMVALEEAGVEPFFRLGVTIENHCAVKAYCIHPPKDYAKWARIAEHVIRHYTEGWADGFKMKIEHWEIWNEPENYPDVMENQMWRGDWESYMRFYGVVSKHLKSKFPHLKIGGYGSCGFYAAVGANQVKAANSSPRLIYFVDCFTNFLVRAKSERWPLDFFSFHSYSHPDEARRQIAYARETLDAYGFESTAMSFNEWLPNPSHDALGTARQAALVMAELINLQNGPCDTAMIYDARCGTGSYSPLFNPFSYKPHKAYFAFVAFNELRKLGTAVRCVDGKDCGLYIAAAKNPAGNCAVLVANCDNAAKPLDIDVGMNVHSCRITDGDRTYETIAFPECLPPNSFIVATGMIQR